VSRIFEEEMRKETFLQPRGTRGPSTPPFKKLLNGAEPSCASTENPAASNREGYSDGKKLPFSLTGEDVQKTTSSSGATVVSQSSDYRPEIEAAAIRIHGLKN